MVRRNKNKRVKIIPYNWYDWSFLWQHPDFWLKLTKINSNAHFKINLRAINYTYNDCYHQSLITYYDYASVGIFSKQHLDLTNQKIYDRLFSLQSRLTMDQILPRHNMNKFQLIYDCNQDQLLIGKYHNQIFYYDQPVFAFKELAINYQFDDLEHFLNFDFDQLIDLINANSINDQNNFYQHLPALINCHFQQNQLDNFKITIEQTYDLQTNKTNAKFILLRFQIEQATLTKSYANQITNDHQWIQLVSDVFSEFNTKINNYQVNKHPKAL